VVHGSLLAVEMFADDMPELIAAAFKAWSEIRETKLQAVHIRAEDKAQRAQWQWF
jgi:hypothetical protein